MTNKKNITLNIFLCILNSFKDVLSEAVLNFSRDGKRWGRSAYGAVLP